MAVFQNMAGTELPSSMTLFVGNVLKAKVIPGAGELVPFTIALSAPGVVSKTKDDARPQPNFQLLEFRADTAGAVQVTATNAKGAKAGPLAITVKERLELPSPITEEGALARLFLAEAPSPMSAGYSPMTALSGMQWMDLVVQNRLQMASSLVGSAGAKTVFDVIKAQNQFDGFSGYPTIASKQARLILDIVDLANDGTHPRQKQFEDHVKAAIAAAARGTIADPCPTKLLWWRTAGHTGPGGTAVKFQTFAGQDFYTLPAKTGTKKN